VPRPGSIKAAITAAKRTGRKALIAAEPSIVSEPDLGGIAQSQDEAFARDVHDEVHRSVVWRRRVRAGSNEKRDENHTAPPDHASMIALGQREALKAAQLLRAVPV
jgi:hypothetical protein